MAIKDFITNDLQATHCFSFDNDTQEIPNVGSPSPTQINGGNYTFVQDPVSYGVSYSLQSNNSTSYTSTEDGAVLDRRKDINDASDGDDSSSYDWKNTERTLMLWSKQLNYETPTVIYEQGGGVNNHAFVAGLGSMITYQSADDKRPFLIAQSRFLPEPNREYLLTGIWQKYDHSDNDNNTIKFYINGVFQQEVAKATNTDGFPSHSGDIVVGNTSEDLKTYNEEKIKFVIRQSNINWLIMTNNVSLSEDLIREFFERTVIPEIIIEGTVAEQQQAFDNLSGNEYGGVNLAIQIRQATDATDYRLFVDNIKFKQDPWLRDIAIQYVGENTLTLENTNGSNAVELSTPAEVDLDGGTTILNGGGSINLIENTIRYFDEATISGSTATKLVTESSGTYVLDAGTIQTVENVSGGDVVIELRNGAPLPNLIETNGSITIINNMYILFKNIEANSSLYVQKDNGDMYVYESDISGNYLLTISREHDGEVWSAVVKKAGYNHQLSQFTINEGAFVSINVNLTERLNADGTSMYLGTSSSIVDVVFDDINQANIDIGDGFAPLQVTFDTTEDALVTQDGMKWLVNENGVCSQFNSAGGDYLFMSSKWRLRRRDPADANATLNAFAISADNTPVDGVNGSVAFLTSDSPTSIAKAVWAEIVDNNQLENSFGEIIKKQKNDHIIINENVKKASKLVPAKDNLD